MNNKVVLLYSGGPDSTTLLYDLCNSGKHVIALTYNYGQIESEQELKHAKLHCEKLGVEHHYFDFSGPMREHYIHPYPQYMRMPKLLIKLGDGSTEGDGVQPLGSSIALLMAASWASSHDIHDVYYAVHSDDRIFRDNDEKFFEQLSSLTAISEGHARRTNFHVPYLDLTKTEVVGVGLRLGIDFEETWSCASASKTHCGICAPCQAREKALAENRISAIEVAGTIS